jgi:hypothetical protein
VYPGSTLKTAEPRVLVNLRNMYHMDFENSLLCIDTVTKGTAEYLLSAYTQQESISHENSGNSTLMIKEKEQRENFYLSLKTNQRRRTLD